METYRDIDSFSEAVDNLRYLGGRSQLVFALTFAAFGFSSSKVPKVIIVVTNKDSPRRDSIESLAETFRQDGKVVNVVAVGTESDFPNLRRLAVQPEDVFTPKSFNDLMCYVPKVASNVLAQTIPPTSSSPTTSMPTTASITTSKVSTTKETTAKTTKLTTASTWRTTTERATPSTVYSPTPPKKSEFCPVVFSVPCPENHLCEHNRQCPGNQRCCKHSCGFLFCAAVDTRAKLGSCPDIPRPSSCSSRSKECNYDMECRRELKCCDDGCGNNICVSPSVTPTPTTVDTRAKLGSCPDVPRPSSCSSRSKECNYDMECRGELKCCDDGCGNNICVPPGVTPTPDVGVLANRCPPYSPYRKCPSSVQDECTCDSDCDQASDYKCCFDGCRRLCRKKAGKECTVKVDIIYLMDSSGSIGFDDFERQKDFVIDLARIFPIGPSASRAAVVTYHDWPKVRANFNDFDSTDSFVKAVDAINQTRGRTRIDRALIKTSEMFKSARRNVQKVLIALTDGAQTPDPDSMALDEASQLLRNQGVKVYALGVGHAINKTQLRSMVESNSDVFLADSFVDLLRKSQEIAVKTCIKITNKTSCVNGVDIAFLMDSSESITNEDFEREKTAVKEIAESFLSASRDSRAGVIMYSGRPELSVNFISQSDFGNFKSAVDALFHRRSMTRIDLALRYASESLFLKPRPSVISIAVVMTDGVQTPGPGVESLGQAVLPLRLKGVRVLAVGVGPRVDRNELKELVTSQADVFQMSSFQELLDKSAKLLETVCPQPPTRPSTTVITTKPRTTTESTATPEATTTQPLPSPPNINTTTTPEPDPTCDKLFDVVFVMDSSRSINMSQYAREKDFVKKLATIFNVGAGSRAAVIIYSDDTRLAIQFEQHSSLQTFLSAVDALPYLQRRTRIDKALNLTDQVLQQARPHFPKAVIVLTDGRQTQDPEAVSLDKAANPLHEQGARVFVVGIGSKISENELHMISKDPSNVFTVDSFENLKDAIRDVAASACVSEITTTSSSGIVDHCPAPFRSCSSVYYTCLSDYQCPSGRKCCFDGCAYSCVLPDGAVTSSTTVPFTTPSQPQCAEAFDLGFAMDSSGSIQDANYQKQKDFIKGVADIRVIGSQAVQLGLIVFSAVPYLSIRFGTLKSTNRPTFKAAVDSVLYFRDRTRIDSALEMAANHLFPGGRQNTVPQVFILITDGRQKSNDPGAVELEQAVGPLKAKQIKIIVVGIGDDVDEDQLKSLVENPVTDLFLVKSFDDLKPLLDNKRLRDALCILPRRRIKGNFS